MYEWERSTGTTSVDCMTIVLILNTSCGDGRFYVFMIQRLNVDITL